ncbi:MAG: glycosyltransferase family 4 protein [Nitrospirota bacterium]|nr:glycosyltransferase family 4 protein [Nitrospirota bacterium]
MQKVLIIIDKWGWSYDTIAKGLVRYNHNPHLVFDIVSVNDDLDFIERHHNHYDLVFALGWTLVCSKKKKEHYREALPFLDRRTLITGIHSHRSWDGYASTPEHSPPPPQELLDQISKIRGINIISRRLFTIFKDAGLSNIMLTENGVDTALFTPTRPVNTDRRHPLIIGFSGSKEITKHDSLKGFSEFILPLDQIPNVQIKVLGGRGEHQVTREEMPDLYNQIDLYICASSSEGFSQSVLEASACGRGVLSTRVGGCEDLIREGLNGFFFHRDLDDIQSLVSRLEADRQLVKALGEANRHITEQYYSWNIKVQDWLSFIESHLPVAQPMG